MITNRASEPGQGQHRYLLSPFRSLGRYAVRFRFRSYEKGGRMPVRPEIERLIKPFGRKDQKDLRHRWIYVERLSEMIPASEGILAISTFSVVEGPMAMLIGVAALTRGHLVIASRATERVIPLEEIQLHQTAQIKGVQAQMYVGGVGPNLALFGANDAGPEMFAELEAAINRSAFQR